MFEKIKNLFKRLWSALQDAFNSRSRETTSPKPTSIVEAPRPTSGDSNVAPSVTVGRPGNEIQISTVTDNFLRGGAGYGTVPPDTGADNTAVDRSGFVLERKGSPYINQLEAGKAYIYGMSTAEGERVELTLLEVVGTPDGMSTTSWVSNSSGFNLSPTAVYGRHGKHIFTSPGGWVTLYVEPKLSGPLGVQRN